MNLTPRLPTEKQKMTGTIPQSDALAEASPSSLSELMSSDPVRLTREQRDRIVLALREQRVRFEEAERNTPARKPRAVKISTPVGEIVKSLDDYM